MSLIIFVLIKIRTWRVFHFSSFCCNLFFFSIHSFKGRPSNNTNASKNSTSTNLDSMRPVNYAWRGFSERNLSFSQHPQLVLNRHTQIHPSQSLECSPLDMPYSALASRFRHSIPLKSSYNPYWQASNPLIPQLPPESSGHYSVIISWLSFPFFFFLSCLF